MAELTEEDVAEMAQEFEDLARAITISAADVKAMRAKLSATMPGDAYSFMLMLRRYTNLFHALFPRMCPFYLQMYEIVQAFRYYSPTAISKLTHQVKTCILWIILLQSRIFAQGKMHGDNACLGEFTHMVKLIKTKNCKIITHVEVTTYLLTPKSTKRKSMEDKEFTPGQYNDNQAYKKVKGKKPRMNHAHNKKLAAWFQQPL